MRLIGAVPALLSAIVLVWLGSREQLGYDSFWHVSIARQEHWARFWFEVADNAHPPLFYLVLKAMLPLGHTMLVYRIPSIVATVVAIVLVCATARRVVADRWLCALAGFVFGLSSSAITLGLEVRQYALATCLTLAALYWYLRLAESAFATPSVRSRALFALFMTLALVTHYSAAFVAVAAAASPLVLAATDRDRWGRWTATAGPNVLTFGLPLAAFAVLYFEHARRWTGRLQHVPEFLFDARREGVVAYVARSTTAEVNLFLPVALPLPVVLAAALALVAVTGVLRTPDERPRDVGPRTGAVLVPLMLAIMTIMTLAAGMAARYPFGGPLRHQFFLFPFVILSAMIALDRLAARLPSPRVRGAFVSVTALGCLAGAVAWMPTFRVTPGLPFAREMRAFRTIFPDTPAVYVAQFSLIPFFVHHHDRHWRLESLSAAHPGFGVWKVSTNGEEFKVCRDLAHWVLDFSEAQLYSNLARCLAATGAPRVAVFEIGRPDPSANATALIGEHAPQAGLRPVSVVVTPDGLFAGLEPRNASRGASTDPER